MITLYAKHYFIVVQTNKQIPWGWGVVFSVSSPTSRGHQFKGTSPVKMHFVQRVKIINVNTLNDGSDFKMHPLFYMRFAHLIHQIHLLGSTTTVHEFIKLSKRL